MAVSHLIFNFLIPQNFQIPPVNFTTNFQPTLQNNNISIMTLDSRVLACVNNRRRNRIVPQIDELPTIQTTKPKLSALKPRTETHTKLPVSEKVDEWSAFKESRMPTSESEVSSIFRRRRDFEDEEDMLVLKRANPVYDSEDEEHFMASPTKRQRAEGPVVLDWGDRLSEDLSAGFTISL